VSEPYFSHALTGNAKNILENFYNARFEPSIAFLEEVILPTR